MDFSRSLAGHGSRYIVKGFTSLPCAQGTGGENLCIDAEDV
jgi:hypothetical protein